MNSRVTDPRRRWTLAHVLTPSVAERTRTKGYSYYVNGTVTITTTTTSMVAADVRGTRVYHVNLTREDGGFIGSCECPFFADRQDVCKHIWALVLAADAQGLLPPESPDAWLDVDAHPHPSGASSHAPAGTAPHRADPWERFLDGVLHQVATSESGSLIAPRYLSGELLYVIDRDVTLQGRGVAVTVLWRQRKKNGEWGRSQPAAVESCGDRAAVRRDRPGDPLHAGRCVGSVRHRLRHHLLSCIIPAARTDYRPRAVVARVEPAAVSS